MVVTPEIVVTTGTFEVLTPEDVAFLKRARAMGDVLTVLLQIADDSAPFLHRAAMLKELNCVEVVVPFSGDAYKVIQSIQPAWIVGRDTCPCDADFERLAATWGGQCVVLGP